MASTGVLEAGTLTVYKDVSSTLTAIGCATQSDISFSNELREILCKDSNGWATYKAGKKTWSISVSALYAMDATLAGDDFYDDLANGDEITVEFTTAVTGDVKYSGTALVSGLDFSAGNFGENASYSLTLQGSGALSKGTVS